MIRYCSLLSRRSLPRHPPSRYSLNRLPLKRSTNARTFGCVILPEGHSARNGIRSCRKSPSTTRSEPSATCARTVKSDAWVNPGHQRLDGARHRRRRKLHFDRYAIAHERPASQPPCTGEAMLQACMRHGLRSAGALCRFNAGVCRGRPELCPLAFGIPQKACRPVCCVACLR